MFSELFLERISNFFSDFFVDKFGFGAIFSILFPADFREHLLH